MIVRAESNITEYTLYKIELKTITKAVSECVKLSEDIKSQKLKSFVDIEKLRFILTKDRDTRKKIIGVLHKRFAKFLEKKNLSGFFQAKDFMQSYARSPLFMAIVTSDLLPVIAKDLQTDDYPLLKEKPEDASYDLCSTIILEDLNFTKEKDWGYFDNIVWFLNKNISSITNPEIKLLDQTPSETQADSIQRPTKKQKLKTDDLSLAECRKIIQEQNDKILRLQKENLDLKEQVKKHKPKSLEPSDSIEQNSDRTPRVQGANYSSWDFFLLPKNSPNSMFENTSEKNTSDSNSTSQAEIPWVDRNGYFKLQQQKIENEGNSSKQQQQNNFQNPMLKWLDNHISSVSQPGQNSDQPNESKSESESEAESGSDVEGMGYK